MIVDMGEGGASNRSVLVVEDNDLNQLVAEGMLQLLGYSSSCVRDGLEALEALRTTEHPIVLMDVHMPRLDGFETTRRIRRELPADRQPYIIAVTASDFAADIRRCREAGMDDFVPKPISKLSLRAGLDRAGHTRGA